MDSPASIPKLNLHSDNLAETWKDFRQNFEIHMLAKELTNKPQHIRVAILLNAVGPEAVKVYNTFKLSDGEKNCFDRVIDEFEKYCTASHRNQLYDTYLFGKRRQTAYEPFDKFVDDLMAMVKHCGYTSDESRMLRDRIVFGVQNRELQKRYFACEQLDLEGAIEMGRAAENDRRDIYGVIKPQTQPPVYKFKLCAYCNLAHSLAVKCPARGQICTHCHTMNHLVQACRKKRQDDERLLAKFTAQQFKS